jgi:hypothetical protein
MTMNRRDAIKTVAAVAIAPVALAELDAQADALPAIPYPWRHAVDALSAEDRARLYRRMATPQFAAMLADVEQSENPVETFGLTLALLALPSADLHYLAEGDHLAQVLAAARA